MKTIRLYVVHNWIKNVDDFLKMFELHSLKDKFELIWDDISPDFLFATDKIYHSKGEFNKFVKYYSKSKINIFIASEAITPDFNIFDYAVGWDVDLKMGDRFALLPPATIYPSKGFLKTIVNDIKSVVEAKAELQKKTGFCNFLYSNWFAHPMRDKLFFEISQYKHVDSLGKHLNNVSIKGTGYEGHRMECVEIKRPYKFSIASENARFVGYTSEKLLTSLASHTVPIYWGDPSVVQYFNPDTFINANEYSDMQSLIAKIQEIDNDDNLWCKMISSPWQTEKQIEMCNKRLFNYIDFFVNIFNQELCDLKRAPNGTMPYVYQNHFINGFELPIKKYINLLVRKIKKFKK